MNAAVPQTNKRRWSIRWAIIFSVLLHALMLSGLPLMALDDRDQPTGPLLTALLQARAIDAPASVAATNTPPSKRPKAPASPRLTSTPEIAVPSASAETPVMPTQTAETTSVPVASSATPAPVASSATSSTVASSATSSTVASSATPTTFFGQQRTQIDFRLLRADGTEIGRVIHTFETDGERYAMRSVTEATGLISLFFAGQLIQESKGVVMSDGLRPDQHIVQRARGRTDRVTFDWSRGQARIEPSDGGKDWPLMAGAQDQLSLLHQVAFYTALGRTPNFSVTNGRRFFEAALQSVGEEMLETELGVLRTVHVRSQPKDEAAVVDIWLAPERQWIPVRVRLRDGRGEAAEQVVRAVRTTP
jgi:hypothetical protein